MIASIKNLPDGTLGFQVSGKVSKTDYTSILVPAVETALKRCLAVKILLIFGDDFEGYAADAVWQDAKMGLQHWHGFERVAVASDAHWVKNMVSAIGFLVPCPIACFDLDQVDGAKRWLLESLGSLQVTQAENVVTVRLIGRLDSAEYAQKNSDIDTAMAAASPVHLLVDLREFDGWESLSALGHHLAFAQRHRKIPKRFAVVGERSWQAAAATHILPHVVDAESRYFKSEDFKEAEAWIRSGA